MRGTAALAGAALIGAGIAVVSLAVEGCGPAARRAPARLEQTIIDRSAALSGALAFSPNGMLLAVTNLAPTDPESAMGSTSVYNLATGRKVVFLQHADGGGVNGVAFSPDGRTLVVTADSNTRTELRLWDLRTGQRGPPLPEPLPAGFSFVAFSPDGKILAAQDHGNGKWGSSTYLWLVATRRVLAILSYRNGGDSPLAFSPDGKTLAIADGWDGTHGTGQSQIHLWNVAARRSRGVLVDPGGYGIAAIAYSPDGKTLAAVAGQKIYLWNAVTGKLAATITGPTHQALFSLAFSPDGRSVAADGNGPAAYVWDARSGELAAVFRDPSGAATSSLTYSPDGRTLAVSDAEGNIYLWNVGGLP